MKPNLWLLVIVLALAGAVGVSAAPAAPPGGETLTGVLTVVSGDPMDMGVPGAAPIERLFLTTADGATVELALDPAARPPDLFRLNGQQVVVQTRAGRPDEAALSGDPSAVVAASIDPAAPPAPIPAAPTEDGRWLTIACKFADAADEPRSVSYFGDMYRATFPGLGHYWPEVSRGQVTVTGDAVGWLQLPLPRSAYMIDEAMPDLGRLRQDCTAAADPFVNFPDYSGINLAFNFQIGCCAWGGGTWLTLDGVERGYHMTWLPPWAFVDIVVVQHEMGHTFGMGHSASSTGGVYADVWDVMGNGRYDCNMATDPQFGCIGTYPIAYHLTTAGWLGPERVYVAGPSADGSPVIHIVTLERSAQPTGGGYLMARVPIDGSETHFYTLETRRRIGYEAKLPADAVVIHEIDTTRAVPAWVVDRRNPWDGSSEEGYWLPGETFVSAAGRIIIRFDSAGPDNATVTIVNGSEERQMILSPTDDTYIQDTTPTTAYGGAAGLKLRGSGTRDEIFLKFNPAQVPPLFNRLRLRLTLTEEANATRPGLLARVPETYEGSGAPWTEEGLTWANRPLFSSQLGTLAGGPVRAGSALEWDITRAYYYYGGLVPLSVQPKGDTRLTYSSKEGPAAPALVVDYLVMPESGETTTFTPTNDAYVSSAQKAAVFNKPKLQVKDAAADFNSYLKFNVAGLSGAVRSATLRLWVLDSGPDGGAVYAVSPFYNGTTAQWLETGLKWNNAPAIGGAPLGRLGAVAVGRWVEVDVTAAVTAALASGNTRVSLALANDAANVVAFSSKEGAHAPELVVATE